MPKIFDAPFAEEAGHHVAEFPAAFEGDERQRHVVERVAATGADFFDDALVRPPAGPKGANQSAHAGSSHRIERNVALLECAEDANVCQATGKTTAQRESDGATGQKSCHPREVSPVAEPHMMMAVQLAWSQPALGSGRVAILLDEHQGLRLVCVGGQAGNQFRLNLARLRVLTGIADNHSSISLPDTSLCPGGEAIVGFIHDVVMAILQTA